MASQQLQPASTPSQRERERETSRDCTWPVGVKGRWTRLAANERTENETEIKTKKRNKDETKEIEASSKLSEASNGHKMEKKAILYFAINRKNCSFYCFQSVFGGASRRVATLSSLRKFACGTRHVVRGKRCVKVKQGSKNKEAKYLQRQREVEKERERQEGSHRVPGSEQVATLEAA